MSKSNNVNNQPKHRTSKIMSSMLLLGMMGLSAQQSAQAADWQSNSADTISSKKGQTFNAATETYKIQSGDTLNAIAEAFDVKTTDLVAANHIQDANLIYAGQELKIEGVAATTFPTPQATQTYSAGAPIISTDPTMQAVPTPEQGPTNEQTPYPTVDVAAHDMNPVSTTNQPTQGLVSQVTSQAATSTVQSQSAATQVQPASTSQVESQNHGISLTSSTSQSQTNAISEQVVSRPQTTQSQAVPGQTQQSSQTTSQATAQPQPTVQTPSSQQSGVNSEKVVNWFTNNQGKLTYSMNGSRNGSDGTADCSGSMTEAIYEAGGSKPAYLYNTDSLHGYLTSNGYKLIAENQGWNAQRGDVVVWGQKGQSAGAAGHVMVISQGDDANGNGAKEISTDYSTGGAANSAVSEHNYNAYASANGNPYSYVYRQ
ncbi:peptidoglycan amidohydrolase family protein [Convivina praedatoris]|uniref:Peptidoglycan hydrolase n=1 Tax=Convivina praedatoris TaxID=2880963 RepID=A0ABN8HCY1_9LACO|nr:peptidoglycan amidohydrolase family protein [Convivina sp. LMG 32447]CAH1851713.1 hypothetical protein R077815_00383 [Convivina sp. LMG 32447]CAH1853782.1 hypothetical protein LMG032447_00715 [Convivina sp. LMG 32447]